MKAMIFKEYGSPDVLHLQEVPKPTPKDNQVLIKIHMTTVTTGDCEIRSFSVPGLFWLVVRLYMGVLKPRKNILGQELAGEVEVVGKDVKRFKPGDKVFASAGLGMGAHAEYICLPEASDMTMIALIPPNMTYREAVTLPVGGMVAWDFIHQAKLQPGQSILINGAGGSIGTYAIQLAKSFGAEVTAVDSRDKLELLRSIGADHVIDYTQEDFTRSGKTYDAIFDIVGKTSFSSSVASLKPNGRYLLGNPTASQLFRGSLLSMNSSKRIIMGSNEEKSEDVADLAAFVAAGKMKSIIDREYPLANIADAHRYVEAGHKKGHVVITVAN